MIALSAFGPSATRADPLAASPTPRPERLALLLAALLGGGCSGDGAIEPTDEPPVVSRCAADELGLPDGSCITPGVPSDSCGDGFEHDGDNGCLAILPSEPCPPGQLATPGETECHEISPCGSGRWGDIPVAGDTQHVDGSYTGGVSDGSAAQPWTTIEQAVDGAAPGAVVAVAAGRYVERVQILDAPVQLIGVCPAQVEIVTPGAGQAAIEVLVGGAVVQGLALTGPGVGLVASGADPLLLQDLHVHDTPAIAIQLLDNLGPVNVELRNSLIEGAVGAGVLAAGTTGFIHGTAIRDVQASPAVGNGTLLSVIRGVPSEAPASVTATSLLLERGVIGAYASGSVLTMDQSVVRDGQADSDGYWGNGILAQDDTSTPSTLSVRASTVERITTAGIAGVGASAQLEHVTVRQVHLPPNMHPLVKAHSSYGVVAQDALDTGSPAQLSMTGSTVDGVQGLGILVAGAEADIFGVVIRNIDAVPVGVARGLNVQVNLETQQSASATLGESLIEGVDEAGIFGLDANLTIERSVVRSNHPRPDGHNGDGMALASHAEALVVLTNNRIDHNARAGIASFGAHVQMSGNELICNPIAINGELRGALPFVFDDLGGNRCGCPAANSSCQVQSSGISPPEPLP